jgi:hypothetical protein
MRLPDLSGAGSGEKRWFNVLLGFSAGAAVTFLGMTGMHYWTQSKLKGLDKNNTAQVESASELLHQTQLATLVGQGILMICCIGFFVAGANWFFAMRKRKAGLLR